MLIETSLERTARRDDLAHRIVSLLQDDPRVAQVQQCGSIAEGRDDRYSDIDLVVHVDSLSDREFAEALPNLLQPIGPRLVDGWGLGFLPDTYIRTLYFDDYPLFWHVDIGCISGIHIDGSDIKGTYHWPQIFKIWIAVVKDLARGEDRVDCFADQIAKWANVAGIEGNPAQKLSYFLDLCGARARNRAAPFAAFYERCDELRSEYLLR